MSWLAPYFINQGELTVAEYMKACLYDPQHGYYTTRNPLGVNSDFLTAPETSQMFGELIAIGFVELWQRMEEPAIHMIEMGPGQGTMMQDMVRIWPQAFKDKCQLHMVEVSPVLQAEQQKRIFHPNTVWHTTLESALEQSSGVTFIVANELFDALPINQWVQTDEGWVERKVALSGKGDLSYIPLLGPVKEECLQALTLIDKISKHLQKNEGMALIIDYGYLGPAQGDTLQAMRGHQYKDVLKDPGLCDMTAHVDFQALMTAAQNVYVYGPTTQGHYLSELGIHIRADILKKHATPAEYAQIEKAVHRLTDSAQMGELFKVLALTGQNTPSLIGFSKCIQANY